MEQIQHRYVEARGVKLHVAEIGTGSSTAVVFLLGFPEIWYSWRHQMIALAKVGFHAIAPDFRAYGLSEKPSDPQNASFNGFAEDTVAILDALNIKKAFLAGKDFGSWPAYLISLNHPTRIRGIVSLGVPFLLPGTHSWNSLPEGFYIFRWKEPGRAEADFSRFDVKTIVRNIYILFSRSEIPIAGKTQEIMDLVDPNTPLPPWLTEEDLEAYASLYEHSGFDAPMQVPYKGPRWEKVKDDPKIEVPVLLVIGEKNYSLKFPGIEDYVKSGKMKDYVPDLDLQFLPEGTHFMQEQFPDHINQLMIKFLNDHA